MIPVKLLATEKYENHIDIIDRFVKGRLEKCKNDSPIISEEEFDALKEFTKGLTVKFGALTLEESNQISEDAKKKLIDLKNEGEVAEKKFKAFYEKIINYKLFSRNGKGNYRHDLMAAYDIKTCPYCNRNCISNWESDKGKRTTADCDHILPKSTYPLLALSYYNLIPSCQICNSRMKKDQEGHLNPFTLIDDKRLIFDIDIDPMDLYQDPGKEFGITINPKSKEQYQKEEEKKHLNIFKLESLYQIHTQEIIYMYKRLKFYTKSSSKHLLKEFPRLLGTTEKQVNKKDEDITKEAINTLWYELNLEFSHQYEENLDRPLAKLIQDTHLKLLGCLNQIDAWDEVE